MTEIPVGRHEVEIVHHNIMVIADKAAARFGFLMPDGTLGDFVIWLEGNTPEATKKMEGMIRRQLKLCGHDVDHGSISDLAEFQSKLAGNKVVILAEENKGKVRCSVLLNLDVPKKRIAAIDAAIRSAKSVDDPDPTEFPFPGAEEDVPPPASK